MTGGFGERRSDLDCLAVMRRDPGIDGLQALITIHDTVMIRYLAWVDRADVAFCSHRAPHSFHNVRHPMATINPGGEPLNPGSLESIGS